MGIVSWIILGLIAGFIGSKIVNRQGQGFWLDIALGIVGALVGGFLFDLFGASGVTGLNIYSMLVAVVGSVVVLLIYNAAMGLVSRVTPVHTAMRNSTRDEGGPFEVDNQVLISSHRKLLWSKAMVVSVAEKPKQDSGRHD